MADLESTASLLERVRAGDTRARERLAERFIPKLRRLAHGRLPLQARALKDTDDIVQDTLVRAFKHLAGFENRGEGAFLAWLRQILMHRLYDEGRSPASRPRQVPLGEDLPDGNRSSPLEDLIGRETLGIYEGALAQLSEEWRNAIVLRFDFEYTYPEMARALGSPSPDAARMLVVRGLVRLIELMQEKGVS